MFDTAPPTATAASPNSAWDRGTWTIVVVVALALLVSLIQATPTPSLVIPSTLLAGLYTLVGARFGDRLVESSSTGRKSLYFALQLALLGILALVFVEHRVFATAWLFHMPLVAHAQMVWKKLGTALVCCASMGLILVHIYLLAGWDEVPTSFFSIGTAFAFVLVFTDVAMRESAARADSQRLGAELEEANRRLGEYAVQAEELSASRERARMAREIHDSVGHSLTAVHMQIEAARAMLDHDPEKTRTALDKAQRCIQEGLGEIRGSVSALRADPLEGRSLHAALADLVDLGQSSGLAVRLAIAGRQRPLTEAVGLVLFRCAQEGLTNARKHARARNVTLELDYDSEPLPGDSLPGWADTPPVPGKHRIRLRVIDDGVGAEATDGGFGLLGLRERARQLDGRVAVGPGPEGGFELRLELPTPLPGSESSGDTEDGRRDVERRMPA